MSVAANGWRGRLLLADGFVAYLGAGSRAEHHAHYAVQLVWGLGHKVEITSDSIRHMVVWVSRTHRTQRLGQTGLPRR